MNGEIYPQISQMDTDSEVQENNLRKSADKEGLEGDECINEWSSKPLGTLCTIKTGKKDVNEGSPNGAFPFFTCSREIHASDSYSFDTEAILIAGNGAVGETKLYRGKFEAYQRTYVLDEFQEDLDYIFYVLRGSLSEALSKVVSGSTMPYIRKGDLERFPIPLPPLPEQKKIANILSTVQRAIEAQERIIQTTTELKKALMQKLFTEGLRNEPQKQTEIGLVPESWEVVRCEAVCDTISVGIVVKPSSYYVKKGVPAFRSQNVREDRIQPEPMVYISQEANNGPVKKSKLSEGDVLIVRTGYPGTSCVVPPEFDGSNCIDLIFVRPNKAKLRSHYLSRFFNSDAAKVQVQAGKIGLAQQHFNVGAVKNTQMPLPPTNQQDEIVAHLELIDSKHNLTTLKRNTLQDLFRTLLHELMTAKIRVHDNLN